MKKTVVILLVLGCCLLGGQLYAEYIASKDVSLMRIQKIISEQYGTVMDDGELTVKGNGDKIFVKFAGDDKMKILCFTGFFRKYEKRTTQDMINLANKWNSQMRFLRVAIEQDGSIICDYYLVCTDGIQSENLLVTLQWFMEMKNSFAEFVIDESKQIKNK